MVKTWRGHNVTVETGHARHVTEKTWSTNGRDIAAGNHDGHVRNNATMVTRVGDPVDRRGGGM
jgi:hypothetical protein